MHNTMLIVDASVFVRHALYELFTRQGDFDVCGVAEDGCEAVEVAGQLHPDLIVLELSMPVMNGMDAARVLKQVGSSDLPTQSSKFYWRCANE